MAEAVSSALLHEEKLEFGSEVEEGKHKRSEETPDTLLLNDDNRHNDDSATAAQLRFTYLCTALACTSSVLLGYDIGIMSGAVVYMKRDFGLSKFKVELIISSFSFCAAGGSLMAGDMAARFGRRLTIGFAAILFLCGSVLMAFANSFMVILFGRVILGIATGTGVLIAPLYSAELSPEHIRGKLVSYVEISINVGILTGYLFAYAFKDLSDDTAWRWMVGLGACPSVVLFIGIMIMPESPRWLLEKDRQQEAKDVLSMFMSTSEMEKSMSEINETISLERSNVRIAWLDLFCPKLQDCLDWFSSVCGDGHSTRIRLDTMSELSNSALKHTLFIGLTLSFFNQMVGTEAVTYYTPMILEDVEGDDASDSKIFLGTIIVGIVKLSFIFVASMKLDDTGRRPLLLLSSAIMVVALAGMALCHAIGFMEGAGWLTVLFLCLFTAGFSIGWGPINWVLTAEIFPLTVRSQAMSFCMLLNRLMSGTVSMCFLTIQNLLSTQGTWWLFCFIAFCSGLFVYYYVPETKGKTLEEITALIIAQTKRRRGFHRTARKISKHSMSTPVMEGVGSENLIPIKMGGLPPVFVPTYSGDQSTSV